MLHLILGGAAFQRCDKGLHFCRASAPEVRILTFSANCLAAEGRPCIVASVNCERSDLAPWVGAWERSGVRSAGVRTWQRRIVELQPQSGVIGQPGTAVLG